MDKEFTFEMMVRSFPDLFKRLERMEGMLLEQANPKKAEADIMNITEASKMLNLTVATIYSMASRKQIPYAKRGKKLYFSRVELTEYIRGGKVLTNGEVKQNAVKSAAKAMQKGCGE